MRLVGNVGVSGQELGRLHCGQAPLEIGDLMRGLTWAAWTRVSVRGLS